MYLNKMHFFLKLRRQSKNPLVREYYSSRSVRALKQVHQGPRVNRQVSKLVSKFSQPVSQ